MKVLLEEVCPHNLFLIFLEKPENFQKLKPFKLFDCKSY